MKRFISLRFKLAIYTIFFIIISMMTMGYVSDIYLHSYYEKHTKNKLHEAFQDISLQLKLIEKDTLQTLRFVSENKEIVASLNLINNYEDIDNYDKVLFDEEKKRIIKNLEIEGKYALSNHISIYDSKYKLVAYIDKENEVDEQGYISYKNSEPVYYYKQNYTNDYKIRKYPTHFERTIKLSSNPGQYQLQNSGIEYEKDSKNLILKSDIAIFRTYSNHKNSIVGYIKAYNVISIEKINKLIDNKNLTLYYNFSSDNKAVSNSSPILFSKYSADELNLEENENSFFSSVNIALNEGFLALSAKLDRSELNDLLNQSQNILIVTLILIILSTLIISLIVLNRMISMPFKTLLEGIKVISNGDYSKHISLDSNDELGTISKEFNNMALKIAKREHELDELAYIDLLTQMPNRMMFTQQLELAISRAKRNDSTIAVFFLDIDDFKIINDTLGHNVGDELLVEVSKRLKSSMRKNDLIARIGGDEFNILVEDIKSPALIEEIAKKIIYTMQEPFIVEDHSMHVTISVGIAVYPEDGEDNTTILKNADLAMYHAKESGRNQYKFFSQKLEESLQIRTVMLKELKQAVQNNELKLFYQPKFSLKDGSIKTIEALIRWENKKLGFVMPDQFIPLSEISGEIINLGAWIMHQACSDLANLQKLNLTIKQVSVNVSNKQFAEGNMVELIQECLNSSGISPTSLEIEMTESYIHDHTQEAIETLHEIRALGVDLAIDDFGTGYSSMSYLKKLPLSRLKIDKSFIDDIPDDNDDVEITKVIIALAKVLGLSITAEGIETTEQMKFLKELECDEGQGYICSRPIPYEDLVILLKNSPKCK